MADYPAITKLSELDFATPADTEVGNKLDDSIRQVKAFLKTYLANALDDNGNLKSAVTTGTSLGNQVVEGSTANSSGAPKHIKLATVSTPDLRDAAVSAAKLSSSGSVDADRAVGPDHIKNNAVITRHIAAQNVEGSTDNTGATPGQIKQATVGTAELRDLAVAAAKLASHASDNAARAVDSNHIKDNAVISRTVADLAITAGKIDRSGGTDAAPLLWVGGAAGAFCTIGGILSATKSGSVLTFALSGASGSGSSAGVLYASVQERKGNGSGAGNSTAGTFVARGPWSEISDGANMVGVSGTSITIQKQGNYFVRVSVPGYSVGLHRSKLRQTSGTAQDILLGSSEAAGPGSTSRTIIEGFVSTPADATIWEVQHYCEKTFVNGFGQPSSSTGGAEEVYAIVEIIKV